MLRDSIAAVQRRLESVFAVANFGAASLFWLAAAFLISAPEYGTLMTIQASVLLLVGIFTLRTQDLVYYLTHTKDYGLERAYRTGVAIELLAAACCLAVGSAIALWFARARFADPQLAWIYLLVATSGVVQQASVARLRRLGLTGRIVLADGAALAGWVAAAAYLALGMPGPAGLLLIVGGAPQAIRSAVVWGAAALARAPDQSERLGSPPWKTALAFVARGQTINVVKNGATSIETLIVSAFFSPAVVAMYRLTKSTQGLAGAVSNVVFQQGMGAIAETGAGERRRLWREVRWRGWRAWLVAYVFGVAFAFAYAWQKPEVWPWEFQAIMAASYLAFLPAILLQGSFIVLSLAGHHGVLTRAYGLSAVVLLGLSTVLLAVPSIGVFLAALALANWLRTWMLDRAATRELAAGEPAAAAGFGR